MKHILLIFFLTAAFSPCKAQSLIGKWGLTSHYINNEGGWKKLNNSCISLAADTLIILADSTFKYYTYYKGINDDGYMYGKWTLKGSKFKLYPVDYEPKLYDGTWSEVNGEFFTPKGEIILYQAHCMEVFGQSHFKKKTKIY